LADTNVLPMTLRVREMRLDFLTFSTKAAIVAMLL
jgi:hypothetical protein